MDLYNSRTISHGLVDVGLSNGDLLLILLLVLSKLGALEVGFDGEPELLRVSLRRHLEERGAEELPLPECSTKCYFVFSKITNENYHDSATYLTGLLALVQFNFTINYFSLNLMTLYNLIVCHMYLL